MVMKSAVCPSVSVVKVLELSGLVYTGADSYFYDITTSKVSMKKKAFDAHKVSMLLEKNQRINPSPAGIFKDWVIH